MKYDHPPLYKSDETRAFSYDGLTLAFSKLFEPGWHPFHGPRLSVFPRSVALQDMKQAVSYSCWPDLATLVENEDARQLMYYPQEQSSCSLRLLFDKRTRRCEVFVYHDEGLLLQRSLAFATPEEVASHGAS